MPADSPARLLVGPLLRRVVDTRATVWVQTGAPATVEVRAGTAGGKAPTFSAFGHHYALVVVEGLAPGADTPYEVLLDGERAWPEPDSPYPPSVISTRAERDADQPVRLIFGSCRETTQRATKRSLPPDALDAYARRLMAGADRPDLLVLLGDQVYADETSPKVRRLVRRRRRTGRGAPEGAPDGQVIDYDEYTALYLESWRDPEIRWLLSTVPSVMIFDDHEIIDDWNSSAAWRRDVRRLPWWAERIRSGLASYWVYQHLGNLHPDEIAADPIYRAVTATGDATGILRDFGGRVDDEVGSSTAPRYRWSFAVDIGRTRLIVLDNRCNRVLDPPHRAMLPPAEWGWFLDQAHGDYDHLVVGTSLPWLMPPAIHHLEAWNERLAGSRGRVLPALAERARRLWDLEHWAAFQRSFAALAELFARIGGGPRGGDPAGSGDPVGAGPAYAAPASISVLSGDVHHSYVARAHFRTDVTAPVHQLTCSPFHNQVPAALRPLMKLGWRRGPAAVARGLARSAGLPGPVVRWSNVAGPYFGNAVGTLTHRGRCAEVRIEGTRKDGTLAPVAELTLTD